MRKRTMRLLIAMFCVVAVSGCASKELVKSGEMAASPASGGRGALPADPTADGGMTGEQIAQDAVVGEESAVETSGASSSAATLDTVYFEYDSHLLSPEARTILVRNADWLRKNAAAKVQIEGHCDERGADAYNLALGERRANAALRYLQSLGIKADRLGAVSYGSEKQAVPGHDETAWAKNRRVELVPQL